MLHRENRHFESKAYIARSKGIDFPASIHDNIEMVFVEEGSVTATCNNKKYFLGKNDLFIVFPNQLHSYTDSVKSGDSRYHVFLAPPSKISQYADILHKKEPVCPVVNLNDENLINAMKIAEHYYLFGTESVLSDLISAVFGIVLAKFELTSRTTPHDRLSRLLFYCHENFTEPITVNRISQELKISKSHISRIFSKSLGVSFNDYINTLRLERAVSLFKDDKYSITDISSLSGFNSIRTFNYAFKKKYGTSPTQFVATYYLKKPKRKF